MLNHYYYDPQTLEQYRTGPAGEHLDEFITWLEGLGFRYRSIRRIVRGASAFARWAQVLDQNLFHSDTEFSFKLIHPPIVVAELLFNRRPCNELRSF